MQSKNIQPHPPASGVAPWPSMAARGLTAHATRTSSPETPGRPSSTPTRQSHTRKLGLMSGVGHLDPSAVRKGLPPASGPPAPKQRQRQLGVQSPRARSSSPSPCPPTPRLGPPPASPSWRARSRHWRPASAPPSTNARTSVRRRRSHRRLPAAPRRHPEWTRCAPRSGRHRPQRLSPSSRGPVGSRGQSLEARHGLTGCEGSAVPPRRWTSAWFNSRCRRLLVPRWQ